MNDHVSDPRVTVDRSPDSDDGVPSSLELTVSGGRNGIEARYSDMERLGRLYGATAGRLAEAAWQDKAEAADGDLLASAVLSPDSFAAAEAAILDATYGPRGLVVHAATIEAQSLCFVGVVEIYQAADEARWAAIEALQYGLGYVVGYHLPEIALAGGLAYGTLYLIDPALAGMTEEELVEYLEDHPEVLETLVGGGGGLLDGMSANPLTAPLMDALGLDGFHPDTGSAADDLGELLFGDYEGALNPDYDGPIFDHEPPRGLEDLIEDLGITAAGDVPDGVISIQQLTGDDGRGTYVVQLPGTDDFLSELRLQPSVAGSPFVGGIGGQADCATVTSADPVCGSLQLPQGATSSQVLLSRGLCDAAYAGCGSTRGSVVQFLADLGGLYSKTSPARMIVRCDKSLCGNRGLTKIRLNYSLLGNAALGPAPACATKNRIGQSQEVCVDYRSSSRDNAGDSHLHLLLTHDARISVS